MNEANANYAPNPENGQLKGGPIQADQLFGAQVEQPQQFPYAGQAPAYYYAQPQDAAGQQAQPVAYASQQPFQYMPVPQMGQYADPQVTEWAAQQAYAQQAYQQQMYAQPAYADPAYQQQAYPQQMYQQPAYAEQAYSPQAYPQQAYQQQTYAQPQYAQPAYDQQAYAQQPVQWAGQEPAQQPVVNESAPSAQVQEPAAAIPVEPVAVASAEPAVAVSAEPEAADPVQPVAPLEPAPAAPVEFAAPLEPAPAVEQPVSDEAAVASSVEDDDAEDVVADGRKATSRVFMQNRELSWLTFNERVLDQGADESVPLLERLNFISIFWSNLQEFFMVRVGSLTDLSYIEPPVKDSKTGMTPKEQIKAIHERCRELYPIQESYYEHVRGSLAKEGVRHLRPDDLSDEQRNYLSGLVKYNIEPFLSPQIINPRHPFPHLENGKLYILVRLDDEADEVPEKKKKKGKKAKKDKGGAQGVVLGLIPLPHQCERVIKLPGRGFQFILLEHAIEMYAAEIFSMYTIKHTNVICVTRNADIDANQTGDEQDEDYREHMKRLLKQRARLAPVRLECERPLSPVMQKHMLKKLGLKRSQVYDTTVPLDLSWTWGLGSRLSDSKRARLTNPPFTPAWPVAFDRKRRIMDQVTEKEVLLSYPYESMDPFVQLLKEAAFDPTVVSIKITLYRLASQSQLAEALITAAENGKQVTALFELRARFDESNNIEWSQRFEQAGCNVIYGFREYKVHSKICCITRQLPDGSIQRITQLGTGNYNEKTAKLYTDFSFITTDEAFGIDATEFFRNMQLENVSDNYQVLRVAPLQIKTMILDNLDRQIALARAGKPCGAFLKANSVTDKDVIEKIAEASQAGVGITLFVRGICCLVPEVKGLTDNVRVVSIVGRLLEHSRIYCFGTPDDCTIYLSSADLMTRNLNKRVEIAWPIQSAEIRWQILDYIDVCLHDTAKLRELRPNLSYTPLGAFCDLDDEGNTQLPFDAQAALIEHAAALSEQVKEQDEARMASVAQLPQTLEGEAAAQIAPAHTAPVAEAVVEPEPFGLSVEAPAEDVVADVPEQAPQDETPLWAAVPEQAEPMGATIQEPAFEAQPVVQDAAPFATPDSEAPQPQAVADPIVEQPSAEAPLETQAMDEPLAAEQPFTEAAMVAQPAAEEPIAVQPAAEVPVEAQPVVEQQESAPVDQFGLQVPVFSMPALDFEPSGTTGLESQAQAVPQQTQTGLTEMTIEELLGTAPAAQELAAQEPAVQDPGVQDLAAHIPLAQEPVAQEPVAQIPLAQELPVQEPAVQVQQQPQVVSAAQLQEVEPQAAPTPAVEGAQAVSSDGVSLMTEGFRFVTDDAPQEQPAAAQAPAATAPQVTQAQPQQESGEPPKDFFDEKMRDLEMPPQKKGFFSRFRKK